MRCDSSQASLKRQSRVVNNVHQDLKLGTQANNIMDIENDVLDFYSSNVQVTHFKCDICMLTFRTPSERNEHILNHLQKTTCSVCHLTLIQLGNIWYSPHEHTNHNIIKNETNLVEEIECQTTSMLYTNDGRDDTNQLGTKHELDDGDNGDNSDDDGESVVDNAIENSAEMDNEVTVEQEFVTLPEHPEVKLVDIVDILTKEATKNQCDVCGKTFCKPSNVVRHRKIHNIPSNVTKSVRTTRTTAPAENTWQCVNCKLEFSSKINLNQHHKTSCENSEGYDKDKLNLESNENLPKGKSKSSKSCHLCNKVFPSNNTLESHLNMHFGMRPYKCKFCSKTWTNKKSLRDHQKRHAVPVNKHNIQSLNIMNDERCEEAIVLGRNEQSDLTSFPVNDGIDKDETELNETTLEPELLTLPERVELKPVDIVDIPTNEETKNQCDVFGKTWQCVYCKLDFSSKINLNQHHKTSCENSEGYEKDKLNLESKGKSKSSKSCHLCNKVFSSSNTLESHLNMHLGMRPYKCKFCSKTWTNKKSLRDHQKRHAVPVNKHNIQSLNIVENQCDVCGKTFCQPRNLVEHRKLHNIMSNVSKSTQMKKTFEMAENTWQLNETGEQTMENQIKKVRGKKHICSVCNKRFSRTDALKYHMNLHLGLRPYECKECGKTFFDRRNLETHLKTHGIFKDLNDDIEISANVNGGKMIITPNQIYNSQTCPICDKQFENNWRTRLHLKKHEILFTCKICESAFLSMDQCHSHKSSAHHNLEGINVRNYEDTLHRGNDPIDWVCEYCNKVFELEMFFAKHILKDHSEDKQEHQCTICAAIFSNLNDLLAHMRAHPESSQHKCDFDGCGQTFAYKSILEPHLIKHNKNNRLIIRKTQDDLNEVTKQRAMIKLDGSCDNNSLVEEALTCNFCSKKCLSHTLLRCHVKEVHMKSNERIKCTVAECNRIYKSQESMRNHVKTDHPEAVKECEVCSKEFYSEGELAKHRVKHQTEGTFACSICPKTFTRKSILQTHLGTHEKEVACNICGKKFAKVDSMLEHRERHGKELIVTCKFKGCNQTFENRSALSFHSMQHPEDEKERHICTICGKKLSKSGLIGHMNSHTGARPFLCKVCGKSFNKSSSLRRHTMIHTGEKPYVCDIDGCSQTYRDSIDLKRHKFSVHKIYTKKHICSICSKVFSENKLLTKHINSVHGCNEADSNT